METHFLRYEEADHLMPGNHEAGESGVVGRPEHVGMASLVHITHASGQDLADNLDE